MTDTGVVLGMPISFRIVATFSRKVDNGIARCPEPCGIHTSTKARGKCRQVEAPPSTCICLFWYLVPKEEAAL